MNNFVFLDNGFKDTYEILENLESISKKYKLELPPEFADNLIYIQKNYNASKIVCEGHTKIVLDSSSKTVAKVYKSDIQYKQESFFYTHLRKNKYQNLLPKTVFRRCYSIQDKIQPLQYDSEIPEHLREVIFDSGAAQFGRDSNADVLIIDFENVNLKKLGLQVSKSLKNIFDQKAK
jgi:uridylate kinase